MRRIVATMLVGSLVLTTPCLVTAQEAASAEQEEQFNALTAQATEAYEAGDYVKAAELFEQAYALKPVSNILYNIGRINEESGNIDGAIEFYDRFVVAPNVEQSARRDALERLKTLREVKAVRSGGAVAEADQTEATPTETVAVAEVEAEPNPAKTLGWVLVGVGGGSLVASGVFGLLAQSRHNAFEEAPTLQERRDAAAAGRTHSVIADSLLITGVVAAVTGTVILLVSAGEAEAAPETASWTVSPLVGQKAVGMGLQLSF